MSRKQETGQSIFYANSPIPRQKKSLQVFDEPNQGSTSKKEPNGNQQGGFYSYTQQASVSPKLPTNNDANKQNTEEEGGFLSWLPCAKWCSLKNYSHHFNVTTADVLAALKQGCLFWKGTYFKQTKQQWDIYGAFWLMTTLAFCLGATMNFINFQTRSDFSYDFQSISLAFFMVWALGFGYPLLLALILRSLSVEVAYTQMISGYGYSMTLYVPCILLCCFNVCLLNWLLLGIGATAKAIFLFRNLFENLDIPAAKKMLVIGLIVGEVIFQLILFKINFIQCPEAQNTSAVATHHYHQAHLVNYPQTYHQTGYLHRHSLSVEPFY